MASRPVRPRPSGADRTGRGRFGGARHSGVGSEPPAHPRRPARPAVAAAALSNAVPGAPGEHGHAVAFRARLVATLRTRRHKVRKFKDYPGARGKRDKYIDEYFGFEDEKELITVAYQILLADRHGKQMLGKLLRDDPGMADLAIGVLMRYDP